MAVPSGNAVLSDKKQFPAPSAAVAGGAGGDAGAVGGAAAAAAGGGGGGAEFNQHHYRNWFPDERDGFIYWLRGEFAAANAMIDSLCHHLREVGEVGEYEAVIACIQQRRCHWNPVLHMQQYFSIAEVSYALQQVAWRWRQRHCDHGKVGGKDFKRFGFGFKGHRVEVAKEIQNSVVDTNGNSTITAVSERNERGSEKYEELNLGGELGKVEDKGSVVTEEHDSHPAQNQNENQTLALYPKTFVGNEMFDGNMVNVVDGLKLYEKLFDEKEVSDLVSLVNDLRAAGKRGHFQVQTYVASKKPMKGHGREMIQLGLPIADAPLDDETAARTSKVDRKIEAIPSLLQDAIERLVDLQVINAKPDSCIIDVYNEGDHSPPRMWPPWFGNPTFVLFLTECDITFGRVIGVDHPGDFKGSLKLSLSPGSLLVMEGKSADFAKHALPSVRKHRMLVTFTKYQPKKSVADNQRPPSPSVSQSSQWGPPSSRSPNHFRHSAGPKHFAAIPTTGVLPAAAIRPQIPPANVVQPLFVPAPAIPFPAPVPIPPGSTGWSAAAGQRHFPPHLPIPGTGVFLPPPGSNSSSQQLSTIATELNVPMETISPLENSNGSGKLTHHKTSPRGKCDRPSPKQGCNGSVDETGNGSAMMKEEQQCA
ncbi:RNA demethylase ALKBH10B isoform X1 [Gossypium hirsutum]|uniref:RNA demethylase ALKBH10B isoform X1 n=2 Tax=Gossypium hirsutum TaxID=3635 RepID=A0ABM3BSQ5_GOSHI|nr:RNA demethylase ALKBH10B isoform X1 [Gossypium hirsutum]